jgi:hypothetical protein
LLASNFATLNLGQALFDRRERLRIKFLRFTLGHEVGEELCGGILISFGKRPQLFENFIKRFCYLRHLCAWTRLNAVMGALTS